MKLTRRNLATLLATVPATVLASGAAATAQPPTAPADDLKAARDRMQQNAAALDKASIPVATEPAFQFKV